MPEAWAIAVQLGMGRREELGSRSPLDDVMRVIYRQERGGRKGDEGWTQWRSNFVRRFKRNRKKAMKLIEQGIDV